MVAIELICQAERSRSLRLQNHFAGASTSLSLIEKTLFKLLVYLCETSL